jgi:dUTP pyrophosphatase
MRSLKMQNLSQTTLIKIKKTHPDAIIPAYQTKGAAGFDFHSVDYHLIMPGDTKLIDTGIAVELPECIELQVRPRSGLSFKTGIRVANSPGTVDEDFRGSIQVILQNTGALPFEIKKGDRIAQGVLSRFEKGEFLEIESLSETERGEKGFGSTGNQ